MKASERERRDWIIIPLILLIGFLCVIIAAQWALRFSPSWKLNADMESHIDPNSNFLTSRPSDFIQPVDPAVLTQPAWINLFLTPGASFVTGTPFPTRTPTSPVQPTVNPPATNTPVATAIPTDTLVFIPWVPSSTPKPKPPKTNVPTETPTNSPPPVADLQITNSDGATVYVPNSTRTYTIVVSNPVGPSDINGATVTDTFSPQISNANWTCVGAGGAVCTAGASGNINDLANLPVGSSVTYIVNVTIAAGASGDLVNTASVGMPASYTDSNPTNDSSIDTDTLITTDPSPGQIGTSPDGNSYNLPAGGSLTLGINLVVNGHAGWDLVYYEYPVPGGILLDWVIVQVSDGNNWYTVFNWGDNIADTNTNMDFNILSNPQTPPEPDQRSIPSAELYNSTGIAIDLDSVVPLGNYSYIRFIAPTGDVDGQMEIDAIQTLP